MSFAGAMGMGGARKLRNDEEREGVMLADIVSAEDLEAEFPSKMRGFLRKRSDQGFFKNWKRRWVALSDRLLYYFADETSANPYGALHPCSAGVPYGNARTHAVARTR